MIERQKCPCCERFIDKSDYMLSETVLAYLDD